MGGSPRKLLTFPQKSEAGLETRATIAQLVGRAASYQAHHVEVTECFTGKGASQHLGPVCLVPLPSSLLSRMELSAILIFSVYRDFPAGGALDVGENVLGKTFFHSHHLYYKLEMFTRQQDTEQIRFKLNNSTPVVSIHSVNQTHAWYKP